MELGLIAKAIVAAAVSASSAVITALQDGHIDTLEWIAIVSAFLIGLGAVWAVPNLPDGVKRYAKSIVAALIAGLAALGTALIDGSISADEWVVIVLALVSGSGLVYVAPNAPNSVDIPPANRVL
jgi:peptidoglycan/LPS O-acetylase OafA/YrhL